MLVPTRATIQPVSAARKPVIVRQLTRDWYAGYASANLADENTPPEPYMNLLDGSGKLIRLAWERIKWVCYVRELGRDSGGSGSDNPERLLRRKFASRPRIAGVWLLLTLVDGDEFEGVAANDRSLLSDVGIMLTPPDTRSNTQRVFVPRTSIRDLTILGVILPKPASRSRNEAQPDLFDTERLPERND